MRLFWSIFGPFPQYLGQKKSSNSKTPRQTTGWKDGQTLFHKACPKGTTTVDWRLKVKDTEYDVS